ncbi:hypothetical protein, partial [Tychonema sp. LEGE 07203]|uniref:hypothetical protein n=1 Tax=Tychonema sp. LEGE 07203 TaxID=1828671 RepID=UPI001D133741
GFLPRFLALYRDLPKKPGFSRPGDKNSIALQKYNSPHKKPGFLQKPGYHTDNINTAQILILQ